MKTLTASLWISISFTRRKHCGLKRQVSRHHVRGCYEGGGPCALFRDCGAYVVFEGGFYHVVSTPRQQNNWCRQEKAREAYCILLSSANFPLRGCVNPASWLLLAAGMSVSHPLIEKYAHPCSLSNLSYALPFPILGPGFSRRDGSYFHDFRDKCREIASKLAKFADCPVGK